MVSIQFPKMLNTGSTNLVSDHTIATKQNLTSLIGSEKGELIGDPQFGVGIKYYMFDQNNYVLRDLFVDEIYTQISLFMPQLIINRKDIQIIQRKKGLLEAVIKVTNRRDFTVNTFNLVLYNMEGE